MTKEKKLLLVEDEKHLAKGLAFNLQKEGYQVDVVEDGESALTYYETNEYEMMILDLMLPGLGGMDVDYLTKPFHLPELLLRVKAILRRKEWYQQASRQEEMFRFDDMWIDFKTGKACGQEGEFYLTSKEIMIMNMLISNEGEPVSREELLEKVWGYSPDTETRTVDNFIARLRKHFEKKPQKPRFIQTVREKGYKFDAQG